MTYILPSRPEENQPVVGGRGNLTGLLMFGNVHVVDFLDEEGKARVEELQALMSRSKYATNKMTYLSWVKYFYEGARRNSPYLLDALLAYWLSYFIFPSPPEDGVNNFVFLPWWSCWLRKRDLR